MKKQKIGSGAPPFWGSDDKEILRRVKTAPLRFPDELWAHATEQVSPQASFIGKNSSETRAHVSRARARERESDPLFETLF